MANTITDTTIENGSKNVIKYIAINSDGTEETGTVIYDSSVLATARGVADPLMCKIRKIKYATSIGNALDANIKLLFDATTDVLATSIPLNHEGEMDFTNIGNLKNTAGTGITGDILITTTGLVSGDSITLELLVTPK